MTHNGTARRKHKPTGGSSLKALVRPWIAEAVSFGRALERTERRARRAFLKSHLSATAEAHAALMYSLVDAELEHQNGDDSAAGRVKALVSLIGHPKAMRAAMGGGAGEDAADAPGPFVKASWDENKHPRDDHGRWVSKDAIADAKEGLAAGDHSAANELRARVTDPKQREKLDAALGGEIDLGRTKRGAAKKDAADKRDAKDAAHEAVRKLRIKAMSEGLSSDDLRELTSHLPHLTVDALRATRTALGASFHGDRAKQSMIAHLNAWAAKEGLRLSGKNRKPKAKDKKGWDSLVNQIVAHGGIDPSDHAFLTHYSGMKDAIEDGIPLGIFRKKKTRGGGGLDSVASELVNAGYVSYDPASHQDEGHALILALKKKAASQHADLTQQYDEAYANYWKVREEIERGGTDRSQIEEAVRGGEEAGRDAATHDPLGELRDEYGEGAEDRGEESEVGDGAGDDSAAGDDSFNFGGNAAPSGADPIYTADKQLDIFGNVVRTKRPSPAAHQPSLITPEMEQGERVRLMEQAMQGWKERSNPDSAAFHERHAAGDELTKHDLVAAALRGEHGDDVKRQVSGALDSFYAGGAGSFAQKHEHVQKAVRPADAANASASSTPDTRSTAERMEQDLTDDAKQELVNEKWRQVSDERLRGEGAGEFVSPNAAVDEDAASDLLERRQKWQQDRPDSEAAQSALAFAQQRLDASRARTATPSPSALARVPGAFGGASAEATGPEAKPQTPAATLATPSDKPKVEYVRAGAGGQVSDVDGKFYRGGQLMPVHGKYSGQVKPEHQGGVGTGDQHQANEDSKGRERTPAQPLTPEQIEDRRQEIETRQKSSEMKAGPLEAFVGINPRTGHAWKGSAAGVATKPWREFAESVGEPKLKEILAALPPPSDPAEREDYDYYLNHPQDFKATAPKKHLKEIPSSADARYAVQHAIQNAKGVDDVHALHKLLTAPVAAKPEAPKPAAAPKPYDPFTDDPPPVKEMTPEEKEKDEVARFASREGYLRNKFGRQVGGEYVEAGQGYWTRGPRGENIVLTHSQMLERMRGKKGAGKGAAPAVAPDVTAPAASPAVGPLLSLPDADFAAAVHEAGGRLTRGWGDKKVFISDVHRELQKSHPDLTLDDFKSRLLAARPSRHVTLSRADLVQFMDPKDVQASVIEDGPNANHFILLPPEHHRERTGSRTLPVRRDQHEMTRAEVMGREKDEFGRKAAGEFHQRKVAEAVKEGKPVRAEVLADYPELGGGKGASAAASAPSSPPPTAFSATSSPKAVAAAADAMQDEHANRTRAKSEADARSAFTPSQHAAIAAAGIHTAGETSLRELAKHGDVDFDALLRRSAAVRERRRQAAAYPWDSRAGGAMSEDIKVAAEELRAEKQRAKK